MIAKEIARTESWNYSSYLKADLHVHSSASYDVLPSRNVSPEAIIKRQNELAMMPILTDHDTLEGVERIVSLGEQVIPGVELKIKPKDLSHTIHTNIFLINKNQLADAEQIAETGNLDGLIDYLNREKLPFQYNHPFWHEPYEHLDIKALPKIAKKFPVIELNAARIKSLNDMAYKMAVDLGKGITSSTDSHVGLHGRAYTLAKGSDFGEFWDNVSHGNSYFVRDNLNIRMVFRELDARIKQALNLDCQAMSEHRFHLGSGIRWVDDILSAINDSKVHKNKKLLRAVSYGLAYPIGLPLTAALLIGPQMLTAYHAPTEIKTGIYEVA